MTTTRLVTGRLLRFSADPFAGDPLAAARVETDAAMLLQDGHIVQIGQAGQLRAAHPDAPVTDYGTRLIVPGFVDAHAHYPQTAMIASWGKRLIDWLNIYTFPEEMRFADPAYAAGIASRYFDLTAAHGTTTMCSFCTIHPASVEAFFAQAQTRRQRVVAGKTCMDRNAPEGLRDTAQSAYDDSKALLGRWSHCLTTIRTAPTGAPTYMSTSKLGRAARATHRKQTKMIY